MTNMIFIAFLHILIPEIILIVRIIIQIIKTQNREKDFSYPDLIEPNFKVLEVFSMILAPLSGLLINGYSEPSGDLNPGMNIKFIPPHLLNHIMVLFFMALIPYLSFQLFKIRSNNATCRLIYLASIWQLLWISSMVLVYLIYSKYAFAAFFPILGLPILAIPVNLFLFIYRLKSAEQIFIFSSKASREKETLISLFIPFIILLFYIPLVYHFQLFSVNELNQLINEFSNQ